MITILVVDDEPDMRQAIALALSAAGYSTIEAADGFQALALYIEHRPHLVITDIFMPDKNGIELVREIRALDPNAKLIAISGGGRTGELLYLGLIQSFGVAETLEKPFRFDRLLSVVERILTDD